MGTRFRALAAPVDASTGDRRRFAEGALTHQQLPMPGRWVREDVGGHDNAVTVSSIDHVEFKGSDVWVEGEWFDDVDPVEMPRLAEDVKEAMYLARKGVVGYSVDLDDFDGTFVRVGEDEELTEADYMDEETEIEFLVTKGRMRASSLVAIPAFVETNHTIQFFDDDGNEIVDVIEDEEDTGEELPIVASVSGDTDLPILDEREHEWDGPGAASAIFDAYSDEDGNIDKAKAGKAFLWVDGEGKNRGDYKLGFADLVDGELKIIPRGVAATAGGRGVDATDLSDSEKDSIKSKICTLYGKLEEKFDDWPACPFMSDDKEEAEDRDEAASIIAAQRYALVANVGVVERYDAALFLPPVVIDGPTPMTYDFERGVAYGHIYPHGSCHVGFKDECRTPPTDEDFSRFHVHPVETSDGVRYVGRITAGGDHAAEEYSLTQVQRAHDQKVTVAYVTAMIDDYGIFVCGPLLPDLDDATLKILSRRVVSGHWPVVGDEGELALAEILALRKTGDPRTSEPGFPIVRYRGGRFAGITAAMGPAPTSPMPNMNADDYARIFRIAYETVKEETERDAERDRLLRELSAVRAQKEEDLREELRSLLY